VKTYVCRFTGRKCSEFFHLSRPCCVQVEALNVWQALAVCRETHEICLSTFEAQEQTAGQPAKTD
jgi:hypothetical protein